MPLHADLNRAPSEASKWGNKTFDTNRKWLNKKPAISRENSKAPELNSVEEIAFTSQKLCEDYIHARLRRSGISDFDLASALSQTDCSLTLQSMGQILELRYPKLFSKISLHLRITYSNEAVVWGAFNKFAANLFVDGITWARIVALFAFAGGLAVDCAAHGRAIFLGRIGYWLAAFIAKNIANWIKNHGGWNGLAVHFSKEKRSQDFDLDEREASRLKKLWGWFTPFRNYTALVMLTSSIVVAAATIYAAKMETKQYKVL